MKPDLLPILRCPRCRTDASFDLEAREVDEREVRTGSLTCRSCAHQATIEDGIVDLLHDPPEFVAREAAGLERFADRLRGEGWDRERLLNLPYEQSGYWFSQAAGIEHLFEVMSFEPGAKLLDVGSNTCWASNMFAERGLDVIALDIADIELQGLRAGEWWFEARGVYFERLLSVMFAPALADESLDYVFCAQVLHHNDRENLHRTFREMHRVLKPGGKLMAINEPLKFLTDFKRDHAAEVDEYEGHEHIYFPHEYLLAARRAGFRVTVMRPNTNPVFRGEPFVLDKHVGARETLFRAAQHLLRTRRRGMQAYTAYKLLFGPDVPLSLIAEKPDTAAA